MRLEYCPYILQFKSPAGTSRGTLTTKLTCLLKIYDHRNPEIFGIGEAALFEGLSKECGQNYELKLLELVSNIALGKATDLTDYPSIQYGLEQAIRDFTSGCKMRYYPSEFTEGNKSIEINGLVWMGDFDTMLQRIDEKIAKGFKCIKLKIGAINWADEIDMIKHIRNKYSERDLTIRVDANGGFTMDNALPRLKRLADWGVHSIEQPIPAGNSDFMRFLTDVSPLPIALDEELIGKNRTEDKAFMLDKINPRYIILKPALCGGFSGSEEWIQLAEERGIGWWITSALESNIGLNSLAQFTATLNNPLPQGLGTGELYVNNFKSPVGLIADKLHFSTNFTPDYNQFENLDWIK